MQSTARFQLGIKGAILWVLAMVLLGVLLAVSVPGEATMGLPWVAAAIGLLGGLAHFLVAMIKTNPENLMTSGAAVAVLATTFTLAAAYWISGSTAPTEPWSLARETLRLLVYVLAPIIGISFFVLRVLLAKSAA